MKSILLHIDNDAAMQARLQVAMDMARSCDAHVTCLQAVNYTVFAPGDFYGSAMAAAIPQIKEAAEHQRAEIEAHLRREDVAWDWRLFYGPAEYNLLVQSALHDVIVVGPHDIGEEGTHSPSAMAGELAIKAPTPVLVVPEDTKAFDPAAPAMIAWNGSAEAAVALRASLPLLKLARAVYLVTIAEKGDEQDRNQFPASAAAAYLSRHGIEPELVEIPRGKAEVSDSLFLAAEMRACGLLVMGAYGHSRLAELLMGGVTRRMLSDPQLPILIAH